MNNVMSSLKQSRK